MIASTTLHLGSKVMLTRECLFLVGFSKDTGRPLNESLSCYPWLVDLKRDSGIANVEFKHIFRTRFQSLSIEVQFI